MEKITKKNIIDFLNQKINKYIETKKNISNENMYISLNYSILQFLKMPSSILMKNNQLLEELCVSAELLTNYETASNMIYQLKNAYSNMTNPKLEIWYDEIQEEYLQVIHKYNEFFSNMLNQHNTLVKEYINYLESNKELNDEYRLLRCALKNDYVLNEKRKKETYDILSQNGYTNDEIIIFFEEYRISNVSKNRAITRADFTIKNLLNIDREELELSKQEIQFDTPSNQSFVKTIIMMIDEAYYDENGMLPISDIISTIPVPTANYGLDLYNYTMKSIINNLIEKLNGLRDDIRNFDVYNDIELKNAIIHDYKVYNTFLYQILNCYQKQMIECEIVDEKLETPEEYLPVYNVLLQKANGEAYIYRDLKKIPEECYSQVVELIQNFQKGINSDKELKLLAKNGQNIIKNSWELRGDQVRVVMKKARDNNYVILGAFQKKDNNEHDKYVSLVSRYDDNYYDNLENIEEEVINDQPEVENLIQMLNENARKSNRY